MNTYMKMNWVRLIRSNASLNHTSTPRCRNHARTIEKHPPTPDNVMQLLDQFPIQPSPEQVDQDLEKSKECDHEHPQGHYSQSVDN
jgi:hypothetical protein